MTDQNSLPGFEPQVDATVWIRWGVKKEDDDPEYTYLVKKNDVFVATITGIYDSSTYEGRKIVSFELDPEHEIRCLCPARLQSELGLNPKRKMRSVAKEGTVVSVKYLGINKAAEGKPHTFEVQFGKASPDVKQEEKKET